MIWINNVKLPNPNKGLRTLRQQLVDSGRNALGQVVAQKVNRRLIKLDALEWGYLTASQWSTILQEIEKFEGELRFWDARTQDFLTLQVYWGDASDEPFTIDPGTGEVLDYINCKCNIVDMGY